MARAKRQFSNEFKSEAVRLSYQRENIKDLADELGIQVARIYKLRAAARTPDTITTSVIKSEDQEIKKLRKQLKNAELELEILKKAVHIFSKNDGKFTNS
jgi:transposase